MSKNNDKGLEFLTSSDASTYSDSKGGWGYKYSDGSASYEGADGSKGYIYSDGTGSYEGADGSRAYFNGKNGVDYYGADGSYEHREPGSGCLDMSSAADSDSSNNSDSELIDALSDLIAAGIGLVGITVWEKGKRLWNKWRKGKK